MFELWRKASGFQSRSVNFENPSGTKGRAAASNRGAKGHACDTLHPGGTMTLMDVKGAGIVTRIWMTADRMKPADLRGLRIDCFWDGAATPAVSAPAGDFFNLPLARMTAFDSELFSSPEGRSLNCFAPMPFRKGARITVTREDDGPPALFFYDINWLAARRLPADALYFHAWWHRENPTALGRDFAVLPRVKGAGRFVGCNVGVITDPRYEDAWWGEGEVKAYLDGDKHLPTLAGTGTEDYILTAWGQKTFACRYHGATVADKDSRQWGFYRFHIPDPVLFGRDCAVALQQIGGAVRTKAVRLMQANRAPMIPVTLATGRDHGYTRLLEQDPARDIADGRLPDTWCNFYRSDDVSACAYFYLDRPENGLPGLQPAAERMAGLAAAEGLKRADG